MCSGDVTIDHYFDYSWTKPSFAPGAAGHEGVDWMSAYTPEYLALSPKNKSHAPMQWDTLHQCRDYDALWKWAEERQLRDDDFISEFGDDLGVFEN